jgi:putative ABC transport system permease protein
MLQNYIKLAWRNIIKRSFYSALNIVGLSIGIAIALLIGVYIWGELQVNRGLKNANDQYFLKSIWKDPNMGPEITSLEPLSKILKEDYPNLVENYYRWDGITSVVSHSDKHFRENIQLGDDTFLSMYGFALLHGNPNTALNDPYSVVITSDLAIKYFGTTDVLGETINIQSFKNTNHDFAITGVLKEIPENSVTKLLSNDENVIFIPFNTAGFWDRDRRGDWNNIYTPSYIELKPGVKIEQVQYALTNIINSKAPDYIKENLKVEPVALTGYYLQKDNGLVLKMLYALSFVCFFILLMAVVNFVNISINSSSARIKEIGVRKVLGGLKKQIVIQFLVESIILVLFSTLLAVAAYPLLSNVFAEIVGKQLPGITTLPVYIISATAILVLVLGVLAGLYPALILSSYNSVDSLKGKLKTVGGSVGLRKSLAGFQFFIAGLVMIVSITVAKQVKYFLGGDLGYNKEMVVSSQVPRDWSPEGVRKMETIRNEFAAIPQVSGVSLSYEIPNGNNGGQKPVYRPGTDLKTAIPMQMMVADENYLATYEIGLKAGSSFKNEEAQRKVILNETAIHALGWKKAEDAIGREVKLTESEHVFTVGGVTNDFHFSSMHQKIQPVIFLNTRLTNNYRFLSFRLKPGNTVESIAKIEQKWSALMPGSSFEYKFMDDTLGKMYQTEVQMKKASDLATILSFIIALMGILGIVSLNVQKKAKEISIRKVLGAEAGSIVMLFIKEYLLVVTLAILVACPVAWFVVNNWLNDYAYRISISPWPFVTAFCVLILSTVLLIIAQTIKASSAKPVKNLAAR